MLYFDLSDRLIRIKIRVLTPALISQLVVGVVARKLGLEYDASLALLAGIDTVSHITYARQGQIDLSEEPW